MSPPGPEPADAAASVPAARLWGVGFAACALLGVLFAVQAIGLRMARDLDPEFLRTSALHLLPWLAWAALLPLIFRLALRWPLTGEAWRQNWWRLAAAALLAPVVHTLLVLLPAIALRADLSFRDPLSLSFGIVFATGAAGALAQFALMSAACHVVVAFRAARERELAAARLVAQLADAELRALRAQLQPHFLFNTLNPGLFTTIS